MSEKMKAKVGLLLSAMAMMSFLATAAVMAAMVQQFPDTNVSLIQMIITIPSLIYFDSAGTGSSKTCKDLL